MYDYDLERRLANWARWEISYIQNRVGYPKQSSIVMFSEGMGIRDEFKSIPLIGNDQAQETGLWIKRMGWHHPDYQYAIQAYYLTTKKIREIADDLLISSRTFKQRLHDAKLWLSGRMSAEDEYKPKSSPKVVQKGLA